MDDFLEALQFLFELLLCFFLSLKSFETIIVLLQHLFISLFLSDCVDVRLLIGSFICMMV